MTILDTREVVAFTAAESPGFELIADYLYPLSQTYYGMVEECTFTFSLGPNEMPGTNWARDLIIDAFEDKVTEQGARMIKLQVYEDTTPLWHTDYRVIATATASPLYWNLIIGAVLLLLILIAINFVIKSVNTFLWGEEGQPPEGFGSIVTLVVVMVVMMLMMNMMGGLGEGQSPRRLT